MMLWPGVTRQIAESVAARGHTKRCYEWGLVRPGRVYVIYRCSWGCYEWDWCNQAEIVESIAARGVFAEA